MILELKAEVTDILFWISKKFPFSSWVEPLLWIEISLDFWQGSDCENWVGSIEVIFYYDFFFLESLKRLKESQNVPEIFSPFFWLQNSPLFHKRLVHNPLWYTKEVKETVSEKAIKFILFLKYPLSCSIP